MAVKKVEQIEPRGAVSPPWVPPRPAEPPVPAEDPVEYPSEDGIPMGSSQTQILWMIECYRILAHWFRARMDMYIAIDLLVYYERGNPDVSVVPDVFVSFGVPMQDLESYKVWAAGKPPDVVWEFGPPSSIKGDAGEKKEKFRQVGVREYWLVDPLGEHHDPRLQGFELVAGKYVRMPWEEHPDSTVAVWSPALQLEQHFTDERLRFWDRKSGKYLELPEEEKERLRLEKERLRLEEECLLLEAQRARWEAESRAERAAQERWEATACAESAAQARWEAESRVERTAQARREATSRAERAAQARKEAASRAESAAQAHEVALRKTKALEAQLAELRADARGPRNPV